MKIKVLAVILLLPLFLFANDIDSLKKELAKNLSPEKRLELLKSYTKLLAENDSPELVTYLIETVDLAIDLKEYDLAVKKGTRLCDQYRNQNKKDSALNCLNKLFQFKNEFKNPNSLADLHLKKGGLSFSFENYNEAILHYSKADSIYEITQDTLFKADANYFRAQAYLHKGEFVKGMNSLKTAGELYLLGKDQNYYIGTYIEMASFLALNGMYDKAIEVRKGLLQTPNLGVNEVVAINGNQASDYRKVGKLDLSLASLQKMEAIMSDNKQKPLYPYWKYHLDAGFVSYYLLKNDLQNAKKYYRQLERAVKAELKDKTIADQLYFYKSKISLLEKKYPEALLAAQEYLKLSQQSGDIMNDIEMRYVVYKSHQKLGNVKSALENFERLKSQEDSLYNIQKTNTFFFLQSEFETANKELTIKNQEIELGLIKSQNRLRSLFFGLLILIAIAAALWFYRRNQKKADALTQEIESNKRNLEQNIKQLNEQITERKKVEQMLVSISEKYQLAQSEKEDLILQNPTLVSNDQWDEFKISFIKVYPHFFSKLRMLDQPITNAEERLLALEKLNFKDDEIAKILGISKESVAKTRYRLRKKMNLDKDTDLVTFLENQ